MIKQFFSILIGLLFFVAPAFGCFVCKGRIPELSATQRITLWECCHSFHLPCIYLWSISKPYCPECEMPIKKSIIHQLNSLILENPISPSISEQIDSVMSEKQKFAPTVDPASTTGEQKTGTPDIVSRTSAAKHRILFVICGCTGIAAMVAYYFKDTISELCWYKKDTEPVDTEPQEIA